MPGITTNTTLLAAANQIVVALNELVAKPSGSQGTDVSQIVAALTFNNKGLAEYASMLETNGDTLNENITLISDAIEAQTTLQETRSIAEVTALNTNFDNLITSTDTISTRLTATNSALLGINDQLEECCIGLQARLGEMITAIRNIRLLTPSGVPGDGGGLFLDEPPIPPGSISNNVTVDVEACRRANWAYDYTANFLEECSHLNDIKNSTMTVVYTVVSGLFAGLAIPSTVFAVIVGGIVELATNFNGWGFAQYMGDLRDEFEANKDEIICEFYNYIKTKNYDGVKNLFYEKTVDAVIIMTDTSGLSQVLKDALNYSLPAIVQALNSNFFANKVFDEADVDIEAYTPENPHDCSTCAPQDFNGWWIPTIETAIEVQYCYPSEWLPEADPDTLWGRWDNEGRPAVAQVAAGNLQLISPAFTVDSTPATIIFTIEGGGDGSPGADAQWHYYTYQQGGVWSGAQGSLGNGTHTITINDDAIVQAIIGYHSPFTYQGSPYLTDIQFTNITV